MAGREFGPPPSVIAEFNHVWRNWLNLVFQKIYKRTFTVELQAYNSIGHGSLPMAKGLVLSYPVCLADDTTNEYQSLSFQMPLNWVSGTDLTLTVHFFNAVTQTGVNNVITLIDYKSTASNEVAGSLVQLTDTLSLPNNVVANTLHESGALTIPASALSFNDTVLVRLGRNAATDTCTGDVGYQNIIIEYQGYINHE